MSYNGFRLVRNNESTMELKKGLWTRFAVGGNSRIPKFGLLAAGLQTLLLKLRIPEDNGVLNLQGLS